MKSQTSTLLFFLISFGLSQAQESVQINHNNLKAYLFSNGALLNPNDIHWLSYGTENESVPLVHNTGLWFGGIDPEGNLFVSNNENGGSPGPIDTDTPFNKVWQVTAQQVADHLADYEDNGIIDNPIPAIYSWPGRSNPFFFDYNGGLELPNNGFFSAPFWDQDADGAYNPEVGDYPILEIRGCNIPVIPSQMSWCVFDILHPVNSEPLLEVNLTLFTFDCDEQNPLNETIFTTYKVINISNQAYTDMYWGLFTDPDLGCPFDDYSGSFPERSVAYTYNADNEDEVCFNQLNTFGTNPPAFAVDIYRRPLAPVFDSTIVDTIVELSTSSIMSFNSASAGNPPPATTGPNTTVEYYNYLQGTWRDGSPLTIGGNGYGGDEQTDYAFPGLPEAEDAWTEWRENNTPGDRKSLMSFGPFTLLPGAVNEVISSYSIYNGPGNHLEKAEGLRDQSDQLQAFFDSCFDTENATGLPPCTLAINNNESVTAEAPTFNLFPNPARSTVNIDAKATISRIWLMDATGKQIPIDRESIIDISGLPAGVYIVGAEIDGRLVFQKLIIQP